MTGDHQRAERARLEAAAGLPRPILIAAVVLAFVTIAAAGGARLTGAGRVSAPVSTPTTERYLRFVDERDGAVLALDAATGRPVGQIAPATGGFIRGSLRALARERRMRGVGASEPFRLVRWADGRLTLEDPSTGVQLELAGFGTTNEAAYAVLLAPPQ